MNLINRTAPRALRPLRTRLRSAVRTSVGMGCLALLLQLVAACGGEGGGPMAPTISSVQLSQASLSLLVGETGRLTALATGNNGQSIQATFTWASSNSSVATVDGTGLVSAVSPGTATITATSAGASATSQVTVTPDPALIVLSTTGVGFTAEEGGSNPAAQGVNVTNGGGGTLSQLSTSIAYGAGETPGWLVASLSGTTAPTTIGLSASTGSLEAGSYSASVSVFSAGASNSPQTINVAFTVNEVPAQIVLGTQAVSFQAQAGGANPDPRPLSITNGGGANLGGLTAVIQYAGGQPNGWLNANLGSTTAPSTLTLSANTGSLSAGTYEASVGLASSGATNSPQTVTVTFTVSDAAPEIALSTQAVAFSATMFETNPANKTVTISNSGDGTLSGLGASVRYPAGQPQGWLGAALSSMAAPSTLTLSAALGNLPAGTYQASVDVTSGVASNSPQTVNVTFTVMPPPPLINVNLRFVDFGAIASGANPPDQTVQITNVNGAIPGAPPLTGLTFSIQYATAPPEFWLTGILDQATAPATLRLSARTGSLAPGTYTATVLLTSPVAANNPVDITVTFTVAADACTVPTGSVAPGTTALGSLTGADCVLGGGGASADIWSLTLTGPTTLLMDLTSSEIDSFLLLTTSLVDPTTGGGNLLASDDNGGAAPNAQLRITLGSGTYYIWATSAAAGETGSYALTIDDVPPYLINIYPAFNATRVGIEDVVTVTFSETMDASTINESTFSLIGPTGPMPLAGSRPAPGPVPGTVSYDPFTRTATFTPTGTMPIHEFESVYQVRLTGMRDLAGTPMGQQGWTFTTVLFDPDFEYRMWNYEAGLFWVLACAEVFYPFGCGMKATSPADVHTNNSKWYFTETGAGTNLYRMHAVYGQDNLAATVAPFQGNGNDDTGLYMKVTDTPTSAGQSWSFVYEGDQKYRIYHLLNPGLSLGAISNGRGDAGIFTNNPAWLHQSWTIARLGRR